MALRALPVAAAAVALLTAAPAGATPRSGTAAKIDSHVRALAATQARSGDATADSAAGRGGLDVTAGGRILVDVYVRGDLRATAGALQRAGMQVTGSTARAPVPMVEGWLPLEAADDAAALGAVQAVAAVSDGGTDATLSQGDAAHRGPQARLLGSGFNGAGIKVGVISDSINKVGLGIAASQASGDLPPGPAGVTVLSDATSSPIDEGRAMAEIIYDTAPGITNFFFASGTLGGPVGKAAGIDGLVSNGVKVIADDIFQLGEPFFQDGGVAQAVDRAQAAGVAYFASAGNRARQSYEGTFTPAPSGDHDFGGGDTVQTIGTVPTARFISVALQWAEPWGQASTDLDAFLVRADGTTLPGIITTASDTTDNIVTGLPSTIVRWSNTSGASVAVALRINRKGGTGTPFMKYIARGDFGPFTIAEHNTSSDTINPDAASARGALTVAAIAFNDAGLDTPEPFSSRGPKTRLFDVNGVRLAAPLVLQKPQLAGADNVATSVPMFTSFDGTSAATPSAAGVAVLLRQANPTMPVAELAAIMTDPANTSHCSPAALPDLDCGFGFIFADSAMTQALDATPPDVAGAVAPATPTGANGWYTGDVAVSWTTTDTGSPVGVRTGCDPTAITTDTPGLTPTCAATSAGGTTSQSLAVIKRDATPPAAPAFTGIAPGRFEVGALPAAKAIGCTATDATSGVAPGGCVVAGRSTALGPHRLSATATDAAGLRSTSTLAYVVTRPSLASLKIPTSLRSGRSAKFGFRLAAPATLRFTVERKRSGRKVGKRCLAPTRANRRKPACARFVRVGNITARGKKGANSLTFTGRVAGRKLAPGIYRISVIVIVGTATSRVQTRTVTIRR